MKCKQISIVDALKDNNHYVFDDEWGLSRISLNNIVITTTHNQLFASNELFRKEGNSFVNLNRFFDFLLEDYKDEMSLYVRDSKKNPPQGYWYNNSQIPPGCEKEIKIKTITFKIRYTLIDFLGNYFRDISNKDYEIDFNSRQDIFDYKIYQIEDIQSGDWKHPLLQSIKLNDEYYLYAKGKVKVVELYDYPNTKGIICKVKNSQNGTSDIAYDLNGLFYLPYAKIKNPLISLDSNKNEFELNPFITRKDATINVYWKPISDAAEYIVSLYRINQCKTGRKDIYHIKDFSVDRNTNYLVIEGLIGDAFVIKVSAENRNGEKIAESRGMIQNYPVYMEEFYNNQW